MNQLPTISSYEIKVSRTEQKIPVINGVHLHSIYNPFKEAENFVATNLESLRNKNEILVLGLGFAYHINSIIEKMTMFHGDDFRIIVIEPNASVHNDCLDFNLLHKKNVLVYSGFAIKELYSDLDLIHFLLRKPAVIAHPASFNLYQIYFKDFLTFTAPTQVEEIQKFVEVPEIKKYLRQFEENATLESALYSTVPRKGQFDSMDFLAMAFIEMTKSTLNKNAGEA